eukprot:5795671-Ditylum_brightwellii.AAC.1
MKIDGGIDGKEIMSELVDPFTFKRSSRQRVTSAGKKHCSIQCSGLVWLGRTCVKGLDKLLSFCSDMSTQNTIAD